MKTSSYFVVSPFVSVVTLERSAILLDAYHGIFHGFNRTSMVLWNGIIDEQKKREEVVILLAKRYSLSFEQATCDVDAFIQTLLEKELIYPLHEVPPHLPRTQIALIDPVLPLLWLEAYMTLQHIQQILQQPHGFLRLTRYLDLKQTTRSVCASHSLVIRLRSTIKMVAYRLPYQAACLHQCLALCWMLRRRRIQADVVIGVYTHPFSAHAWVVSQDIIQWEAGLSAYPDERFLHALTVIFPPKEELR